MRLIKATLDYLFLLIEIIWYMLLFVIVFGIMYVVGVGAYTTFIGGI